MLNEHSRKNTELENELKLVGHNLKSLEANGEKAQVREEVFEQQIKLLNAKLKEAEARAELAERTVQKLQSEVDRLEGRTIIQESFEVSFF